MSHNIIQLDMGFEQFDSKEEALFSHYVSELLEHGWIVSAEYHPASTEVIPVYNTHAYVENRNSNDIKEVKLLNNLSYTADWILHWDKKADGVFYWQTGGKYKKGFYPYSKRNAENYIPFYAQQKTSYVDVKGAVHGRSNNSAITFPVVQKILMSQGVFVQKIVVTLDEKGIFARSFTPRTVIVNEVYKVNCKNGKEGDSKLKFKPTLIEQYCASKT